MVRRKKGRTQAARQMYGVSSETLRKASESDASICFCAILWTREAGVFESGVQLGEVADGFALWGAHALVSQAPNPLRF